VATLLSPIETREGDKSVAPPYSCSKLQAVVFLPTFRADRLRVLTLHGIEMRATHAAERNMPTLGLEAGVVAAIIVNPEAEKKGGDEEAVNDRGGDEIHLRARKKRKQAHGRAAHATQKKRRSRRNGAEIFADREW
jgi:hypothetical protein